MLWLINLISKSQSKTSNDSNELDLGCISHKLIGGFALALEEFLETMKGREEKKEQRSRKDRIIKS